MRYLFNQSFDLLCFIVGFSVFIIIFALFVTLQPGKSYAQIGCEVRIVKEGIPGDPTVFPFVTTGTDSDEFGLENGESQDLGIPGGVTATIVEEVPDGWVLQNVECETENVIATEIENGIQLFCSPNGGAAQCFFINVQVGNIPTLSEWGMIAAAAGLGLVGVWFAVRRRKMQDA
ncbi:MAG: IPTL-CTERM sorting domain-containing protein [Thermodesulfobacteriota bacterium]